MQVNMPSEHGSEMKAIRNTGIIVSADPEHAHGVDMSELLSSVSGKINVRYIVRKRDKDDKIIDRLTHTFSCVNLPRL